jgi:hypothetical protein
MAGKRRPAIAIEGTRARPLAARRHVHNNTYNEFYTHPTTPVRLYPPVINRRGVTQPVRSRTISPLPRARNSAIVNN